MDIAYVGRNNDLVRWHPFILHRRFASLAIVELPVLLPPVLRTKRRAMKNGGIGVANVSESLVINESLLKKDADLMEIAFALSPPGRFSGRLNRRKKEPC